MRLQVTLYKCDICGKEYDSKTNMHYISFAKVGDSSQRYYLEVCEDCKKKVEQFIEDMTKIAKMDEEIKDEQIH